MYLKSHSKNETKKLEERLDTERKIFDKELSVNIGIRKFLEEQQEKMNKEYLKMK